MDNRRSPTQARIIHTIPGLLLLLLVRMELVVVVVEVVVVSACYGYSSVNFICRPQNNL